MDEGRGLMARPARRTPQGPPLRLADNDTQFEDGLA